MSTDSSTGIQSAEIALDVLTRLAELGGAQSVSELGRSLDMPRAKVHRYLVSLERRGYVEQDPASARYRLGPQALHTGLAALAEVDFVKLAADGLDALSGAIGQTVFISIWGQHGPTIVQRRAPARDRERAGRLGAAPAQQRHRPGLCRLAARGPGPAPRPGRMGRAAAPGRRRVLAAGRGQPPADPAAALRAHWRATRERGYATVSGHLLHGIDSVSVPVRDAQGGLAGALTSLGLHGGFDLSPDGAPVRGLLAAAADCSRRLGWRA